MDTRGIDGREGHTTMSIVAITRSSVVIGFERKMHMCDQHRVKGTCREIDGREGHGWTWGRMDEREGHTTMSSVAITRSSVVIGFER